MEDSFEAIRQSLRAMEGSYHAVAEGGRLKPGEWMENAKLLKPIAAELQKAAADQISRCQKMLEEKRQAHSQCLAERAEQYALLEGKKGILTQLDAEVIGLVEEIGRISDDIARKQEEIQGHQKRIAEAQSEKKRWDTVFWATCWIPLVNIGTGCKKGGVDAGYRAKVKRLGEEIKSLRERSASLNAQLECLRHQEKGKHEESAEIARQVTAANGRAAKLTAEINGLSSQVWLWQSIYEGCADINVRLGRANGDLETVKSGFEGLLKVQELLDMPATARFVDGRTCKGTCLRAGESLGRNEYLVSANRKYAAVLGEDNALRVYNSEQELWSSGTQGARGQGVVCLDGRGPAALLGTDRTWNTKRPGVGLLAMQDDGNLVAYGSSGQSLWASDTFTYASVESVRFQ